MQLHESTLPSSVQGLRLDLQPWEEGGGREGDRAERSRTEGEREERKEK